MVLWNGSCQVHEAFCEESLIDLWIKNTGSVISLEECGDPPNCEVIAHPECEDSLLRLADFVGSTSALLRRVQESSSKTFIVLTEPGILHKMRQVAPDKVFLEVPGKDGCQCVQCPFMKLSTLEKVRNCLRDNSPQIHLDEQLRLKALRPLELMLEMS